MMHFNEQAKLLAEGGNVRPSNMKLVWVVPPEIFGQFSKQAWLTSHDKKAVKVQGFAACIEQVVVEVGISDRHR